MIHTWNIQYQCIKHVAYHNCCTGNSQILVLVIFYILHILKLSTEKLTNIILHPLELTWNPIHNTVQKDHTSKIHLELFQIHMRISLPSLRAKDLRMSLLIMRTRSFLTLLYVGGIYTRLVYTWYKNIFCVIAVLIVFLASNGKKLIWWKQYQN